LAINKKEQKQLLHIIKRSDESHQTTGSIFISGLPCRQAGFFLKISFPE
jgi:hypothetical protein